MIEKFDFEREGTVPKNKYMIVILQSSEDLIVAPLTTSKDFIPRAHEGKRCVIDDADRLHCYCIPKSHPIGEDGFSFPLDTYIQVQGNLTKRSISDLKNKYLFTNKVKLLDKLTDIEYHDLLACISQSQFIPRGIRRDIAPILDGLRKAKAKRK